MTGVTVNTEEALLVHLLFTACQAAWFLTGQTDAGRGDPCSRQQAELLCVCVYEMLTGKEHEVIWEDEGNVLGSWLQRCTY